MRILSLRRQGGYKGATGFVDLVWKTVRAGRAGTRAQDGPRCGAPRRKGLVRDRAGAFTTVGLQEILGGSREGGSGVPNGRPAIPQYPAHLFWGGPKSAGG
eukprot:12602720-Alexandrium_andersonii.AAC.1